MKYYYHQSKCLYHATYFLDGMFRHNEIFQKNHCNRLYARKWMSLAHSLRYMSPDPLDGYDHYHDDIVQQDAK